VNAQFPLYRGKGTPYTDAVPETKRPAFDAVIFDIDNVLIDTRRSYLDAIRWTVEIYLTADTVPYFVPSAKHRGRSEPVLLSTADVQQFKLLGGFNDDWDCCYGLLIYLTSLGVRQRTTAHLKQVIDIPGFLKRVKKRPLHTAGITGLLGRPKSVRIEKVARIFQEVYLGKELYALLYHREPAYWNKRGLIHREKLMFRKSTLAKLKKAGIRLGIATGRPRYEAVYALKRFHILDFFDAMTTIDDIKKAEQEMKQSLRKPHPYSLVETAGKIGIEKRFLYVGDLPDDILAARRASSSASIRSVAFPWLSTHGPEAHREMELARPDFILRKAVDLPDLVLKGRIKEA